MGGDKHMPAPIGKDKPEQDMSGFLLGLYTDGGEQRSVVDPSSLVKQSVPRRGQYECTKAQEAIFEHAKKRVEKNFPNGHFIGHSGQDDDLGYKSVKDESAGHDNNKGHHSRYAKPSNKYKDVPSVSSSVKSNDHVTRKKVSRAVEKKSSPLGNTEKVDLIKADQGPDEEKSSSIDTEQSIGKTKKVDLVKTGEALVEPKEFSFINMNRPRATKKTQLATKKAELDKEVKPDSEIEAKHQLEEDGWDVLEDAAPAGTRTVNNGKTDIVKPKGWFRWI